MSSVYTKKSGIYYYQRYWTNPETEEVEIYSHLDVQDLQDVMSGL